jgi:DNA replication protein DnaC
MDLIQKRIINDCINCRAQGCNTCKSKFSRIKSYARANIPMDYWMLAFKDFAGDSNFKRMLSKKINNIDEMYETGKSLAFVGNLGTGKTYAAACILKKALVSDYTGQYLNMVDVINNLVSKETDNSTYLDSLINVDFLVIDEFDKRYVFPSDKAESLFGQTLEYVLRSRFQNHMPTILCSNTENLDDVFAGDFARAFSSLKSQYMNVIYVSGKDFRKRE